MDVLPRFIARHEEGKLFLVDARLVLIPVGFHATDEIVLSGELVRFAVSTKSTSDE